MARSDGQRARRFRLVLGWLLTVLFIGVYFVLPDGDEAIPFSFTPSEAPEPSTGPRQVEIVEVTPARPSPGRAVTITFVGAEDDSKVHAFVGKVDMQVLARGRGALVARLPENVGPGRAKLRLVSGSERSKPYALSLRAPNYQKPFRNLIGGFALLIFGIGVLARGAREAVGFASAHTIARLSGRGPSALGLGALLGAVAQSTTASAGILSGLVASNLLAVFPAAIAFLGAQFGAAATPLLTGLIDSREGLLAIALGVMWQALAQDRRSKALSRLVLGAGLMAFGLQTFRPGFEVLLQDPTLLEFLSKLRGHGLLNVAICAGLGAFLVAVLQGPAPVVVLVLLIAQTTAQWDLRTALSLLAGSGLGASVGALLTVSVSRRGRQLALLNLLLGAASTLVAVLTLDVWSHVADWIVPGVPHEVDWGRRGALPNLAPHLGVAFALSQIASACALMPAAAPLAKWLEKRLSPEQQAPLAKIGDPVGVARVALIDVLSAQQRALAPVRELVSAGSRSSGRLAEHCLAEAHAALDELLAGAVPALPDDADGRAIARASFTSMQLQRGLEGLHRQAERLVDSLIAASVSQASMPSLGPTDEAVLGEMHGLLGDGIASLLTLLRERDALDLDSVRSREIQMNALEARARNQLREGTREEGAVGSHLRVLELVDAYESSGNQLYRLAEALEECVEASVARRIV
ncbi:MAG: hypothetical protein QM756_21715 [Polyangiaceae bacterium]